MGHSNRNFMSCRWYNPPNHRCLAEAFLRAAAEVHVKSEHQDTLLLRARNDEHDDIVQVLRVADRARFRRGSP